MQTAQLDDGLATLNRVDINRTRALISSGTSILTNISSIIDQQLSNFSEPINSHNNYIILPSRYTWSQPAGFHFHANYRPTANSFTGMLHIIMCSVIIMQTGGWQQWYNQWDY